MENCNNSTNPTKSATIAPTAPTITFAVASDDACERDRFPTIKKWKADIVISVVTVKRVEGACGQTAKQKANAKAKPVVWSKEMEIFVKGTTADEARSKAHVAADEAARYFSTVILDRAKIVLLGFVPDSFLCKIAIKMPKIFNKLVFLPVSDMKAELTGDVEMVMDYANVPEYVCRDELTQEEQEELRLTMTKNAGIESVEELFGLWDNIKISRA